MVIKRGVKVGQLVFPGGYAQPPSGAGSGPPLTDEECKVAIHETASTLADTQGLGDVVQEYIPD